MYNINMKRFIVVIIICMLAFPYSMVWAKSSSKIDEKDINNSNAIELDLSSDDEDKVIQNNSSSDVIDGAVVKTESIDYPKSSDLREQEYNVLLHEDVHHMQEKDKNISKTIKKNVGKNTQVGASYNTTTSSGEIDDSVSVFTKYEKGKAAVTSSYSQNRKSYNSGEHGTFSVAPELNLNKHLSVKNVYSDSFSTNAVKNEVVMSVKPFKDERTDINFGAGQMYSGRNMPTRTQFSFSTNYRF